jgi:prepilin signal peptidase PulO-like enzyme (type II secretory pathway)
MESFFEAVLAALAGVLTGQAVDLLWGRFYTGEQVRGAVTRCAHCRAPTRPLLLLPFTALVLWDEGRCDNCGEALTLRSVLLPTGSAVLFLLAYAAFDANFGAALLGGLFATMFLTLTFTDLESRLLPNRIIYAGILLAVAFCWGWPDTSFEYILLGGLTGVLIAAAMLLISIPFGPDAFGMGDVKMIVLMGFVLGLPGVLVGVVLGTFAAGAAAAFLLISRRRSRRDYIPHGPFLALGAVIGLFWGADLWPY